MATWPPARDGARHGHERGSVTLGGRRVPVERPRVRAVHGSGGLSVPAYELLSSTEILGRMAMDRMLAGLSTRRYQVGLEPVGQQVSEVASASSRGIQALLGRAFPSSPAGLQRDDRPVL